LFFSFIFLLELATPVVHGRKEGSLLRPRLNLLPRPQTCRHSSMHPHESLAGPCTDTESQTRSHAGGRCCLTEGREGKRKAKARPVAHHHQGSSAVLACRWLHAVLQHPAGRQAGPAQAQLCRSSSMIWKEGKGQSRFGVSCPSHSFSLSASSFTPAFLSSLSVSLSLGVCLFVCVCA